MVIDRDYLNLLHFKYFTVNYFKYFIIIIIINYFKLVNFKDYLIN